MKTKFSILAFLFIAFSLMAQGVKQSPWTTTTNPTNALLGLGTLPAIATPGGGFWSFYGLDGSPLFGSTTYQPAGNYLRTSITNSGVIYSFNSSGQFTMTNPASLPNPSGWTMGTNGHYRGIDQYGNIREWTTNRFTIQTSVGGVSKTLMFSNDMLTVNGALVATNSVTNSQSSVAFGFYSTVTYGATNPVDIINAYQFPQAIGHYVFSTIFNAYTNSLMTNVMLFNSSGLGEWVIGTNLNTASELDNFYVYAGANSFPTNDAGNWITGNGNNATPSSVDVGTLSSSNNVISSISPFGTTNTDLQLGTSGSYAIFQTPSRVKLMEFKAESSQRGINDRLEFYSYTTGQYWTNDNNAAHNFSPGIVTWRLNGGLAPGATFGALPSDPRSVVEVATLFGTVVLTNGVADLSHIADKGTIQEWVLSPNITNANQSMESQLRLYGIGAIAVGNNPSSEHINYTIPAGVIDVRPVTTIIPGVMLRGQTYTGPVTNGGLYSDSSYIHQMTSSGDYIILAGTNTPFNGGILTNLNASQLASGTVPASVLPAFTNNGAILSISGNYALTAADLARATTNRLVIRINTGNGTNILLTTTNAAPSNTVYYVENNPTISSNASLVVLTNLVGCTYVVGFSNVMYYTNVVTINYPLEMLRMTVLNSSNTEVQAEVRSRQQIMDAAGAYSWVTNGQLSGLPLLNTGSSLPAINLTGNVPLAALQLNSTNIFVSGGTPVGGQFIGTNALGQLVLGTPAGGSVPNGLVTNNAAGAVNIATNSTLTASNITATGTFTGNGGGMTNLNASQLITGTVPSSSISGGGNGSYGGVTLSASTITTGNSVLVDGNGYTTRIGTSGIGNGNSAFKWASSGPAIKSTNNADVMIMTSAGTGWANLIANNVTAMGGFISITSFIQTNTAAYSTITNAPSVTLATSWTNPCAGRIQLIVSGTLNMAVAGSTTLTFTNLTTAEGYIVAGSTVSIAGTSYFTDKELLSPGDVIQYTAANTGTATTTLTATTIKKQ